MVHGDDAGLRLPPRLAPTQVVIVVVRDDPAVGERADALAAELAAGGIRVHVDRRTDTSFGRRVVDWELKGVPVRVELGPRDVQAGNATVAQRHDGSKTQVAMSELAGRIPGLLEDQQRTLADEAERFRLERTVEAANVDEAIEAARNGFAVVPADVVSGGGEAALNEHGASVRCLQLPDGTLPAASGSEGLVAVVGRAY
jgi:prolyl-tRNA synthetase